MALVSKSDLVLRGCYSYAWTVRASDPKGQIDFESDRVSKRYGYDVVNFINAYAKSHRLSTRAEAYRIEDLLHQSEHVARAELENYINSRW